MNRFIFALIFFLNQFAFCGVDIPGGVTSGYVSCSNPSSGILNPPYITVSFWFYMDSQNAPNVFIAKRSGTTAGLFFVYFSGTGGGTAAISTYADGAANTWNSPYMPSIGKWTHAVFTYDGLNKMFYADSVPYGPNTDDSGPLTPVSTALIVGSDSISARYFLDGKMDDIRIYNRALNQQEIQSLYLSRSRLNITEGLVLWLPMDEYKTGETIQSGTKFVDRSAYDNYCVWIGTNGMPAPQSILNYP